MLLLIMALATSFRRLQTDRSLEFWVPRKNVKKIYILFSFWMILAVSFGVFINHLGVRNSNISIPVPHVPGEDIPIERAQMRVAAQEQHDWIVKWYVLCLFFIQFTISKYPLNPFPTEIQQHFCFIIEKKMSSAFVYNFGI